MGKMVLQWHPAFQTAPQIGTIVRTYHVVEYKSPEDCFRINDYLKVLSDACNRQIQNGYVKSIWPRMRLHFTPGPCYNDSEAQADSQIGSGAAEGLFHDRGNKWKNGGKGNEDL